MSLTAAYQEAIASNKGSAAPIECLAFDHAGFIDGPARIIASGLTVDTSLPLTLGGTPVLFRYCPTQVTRPGITESGPTPMKIRVENASKFLLPYLRLAVNSTQPITLTYYAYAPAELTRPGEVLSGFRIGSTSLTAQAVEATVTLREIEMQAYPLLMYDRELFPTLQSI